MALRNVLKHRSEASSARKLLELSLNTFHVVSKVEKTEKELPSVPVDRSNGDVPQKLAPPRVTQIDEKGQPDPFLVRVLRGSGHKILHVRIGMGYK